YKIASGHAPDDHFTTSPDRGVRRSGYGRIGCTCSYPSVCGRIVSTPGVHRANALAVIVAAAPNDHFAPGPNYSVKGSSRGGVARAGTCPRVGARIVSASRV